MKRPEQPELDEAEQIEILERIARDEQTNATAGVTAIRALRSVERDRSPTSWQTNSRADRRQARWLSPGVRKLIRELGAR